MNKFWRKHDRNTRVRRRIKRLMQVLVKSQSRRDNLKMPRIK